MKKLLLIVALLFAAFTQAQEVSPYYPAKYTGELLGGFTSQMTYFDSNFIINNVSDVLLYRMNMGIEKRDDSKFGYNGGTIIMHYTDKLSQSGLKKLAITYTIINVADVPVVKSVKITGDKKRVTSFFVNFWKTTMNFEAPSGNSDVSLLMGQDVVKYYFNKGKPYITVTNGTFKTDKEFEEHFKNLKAATAE